MFYGGLNLKAPVDLVMWTKDGAKTLPSVLKRIGEVIPEEFVNNRILVDDQSVDDTREIAGSFGWKVFFNTKGGVSSGANTALSHVKSRLFISFEQDLLLAKDWWRRVPLLLEDRRVAVASGVRVPDQPAALRKLNEYALERYKLADNVKEVDFSRARTLDNTIYRTDIIRKLGGFPQLFRSAGVHTLLAKNVIDAGFGWKVDFSARSIHLRGGLKNELAHYYWYGTCYRRTSHIFQYKYTDLLANALRFFLSPAKGLKIAFTQNAPEIVYIYPLIRLNFFRGMLETNQPTEVGEQQG